MYEGMTKQEALILWEEVEQDKRFAIVAMHSGFNIEQQARLWTLEIRFTYLNRAKHPCRMTALAIRSYDEWQRWKKACQEQEEASAKGKRAPTAKEQRALAGRSRT